METTLVVIRTVNKAKFGQTNHLPLIGDVTFDGDGYVATPIDASIATELANIVSDIEIVSTELLQGDDSDESLQDGDDSDQLLALPSTDTLPSDLIEELTEEDKALIKTKIVQSKFEDLKQVAMQIGCPQEQWTGFNKKDLQNYLLKKVS